MAEQDGRGKRTGQRYSTTTKRSGKRRLKKERGGESPLKKKVARKEAKNGRETNFSRSEGGSRRQAALAFKGEKNGRVAKKGMTYPVDLEQSCAISPEGKRKRGGGAVLGEKKRGPSGIQGGAKKGGGLSKVLSSLGVGHSRGCGLDSENKKKGSTGSWGYRETTFFSLKVVNSGEERLYSSEKKRRVSSESLT